MTNPDEKEGGIDRAGQIYRSINLLTIRRSVRLLCDLESSAIEDFARKYSGVLIFFLNILDRPSSHLLLDKLTDSSIIYLIEEELRTLFIREIAHVSDDLERLVDLTNFLEKVDRPDSNDEILASTTGVLELMLASKKERYAFSYLNNMESTRRKPVLSSLIERNIHAAVGILLYVGEEVYVELLDAVAITRPSLLEFLPSELLQNRLAFKHDLYWKPEIFQKLPAQVKTLLENIKKLRERFQKELAQLKEAKKGQSVQKPLDIVYGMIKDIGDLPADVLLSEMVKEGFLNANEANLLLAVSHSANYAEVTRRKSLP